MNGVAGRSVCIVGINFAPESTGIAPYTTALAESLSAAGSRVHVVTGVPHYPQWRVVDDKYSSGSVWHESQGDLKITRCLHFVPPEPDLIGRAKMEASFFARAMLQVRKDTSDAVIVVTPSLAGLAAGVAGARGRPVAALVQDLTGNAADQSGTTGGRVGGWIARGEYALLRRCVAVGVITPRFGEVLEGNGVAGDKIVTLSNFTHISPVDADPMEARRRLGWPLDRFTVVHTGNMGRKQGLEITVEAAAQAQRQNLPIDFVLVGDGNQRSQLGEAAKGLSNLRFVDPLSSADYPYALAAADLLLLSERSGVMEMSLPSKLTSYSVSGRAIIAAVEPNGITHSVLSSEDAAHFVSPGNAGELLHEADLLRQSDVERTRLAGQARKLYETRYSRDAAEERYVLFASKLLAQSPSVQPKPA